MKLGMQVGLGPGDIVLDGNPAPPPLKGHSPSIFGPYLLQSNGCMDQDATWYGGRPLPRRLCVGWGPHSPKRGRSPPPPQIFVPCLLCPNGWIDEVGTWHGGRPQPRRLCVRWGPSPLSEKGQSPTKFSAHVYCGQTAAWIKMPLGTEVGLGLRDIVFDVDQLNQEKWGTPTPSNCWPMSIMAKWLDGWRRRLVRK